MAYRIAGLIATAIPVRGRTKAGARAVKPAKIDLVSALRSETAANNG
jgi:hypothetical protein